MRHTYAEAGAAGICAHHWIVSEQLVAEAHGLGLHLNTWTVNNPFAARMVADVGVDSITTDRVELIRHALQSTDRNDDGGGRALRSRGWRVLRRPDPSGVDLDGPCRSLLCPR
ncbi:glycerophosphodiester phosphodiesterase family protein [Candidatus Aeolococcus gillhamiae]|uniref:glycerophosphodiester phosphodiesterase n=1 Tax=Candidatus Aeolococcus gillhamiae TaxID=3127015 RepID=UPI003077D0AA